MKTHFLLRTLFICILIFMHATMNSNAQKYFHCMIDFDNPDTNSNIIYYIDTINDPNNIWQIGHSHKSVLTGTGKVLITDTLNPYPANDTSYFYIKIWNHGVVFPVDFTLLFEIATNTDTCKDYGFIELSLDNGQNWIMMNDSIKAICWNYPYNGYWYPYSGNHSNNSYEVSLARSGFWCFSDSIVVQDTIILRYGFISDSVFDNKEGLLIHSITFITGQGEGVEYYKKELVSYPNPSDGKIIFQNPPGEDIESFLILNVKGGEVFSSGVIKGNNRFDLGFLPDGMYLLVFYNKERKIIYTSKLQIIH